MRTELYVGLHPTWPNKGRHILACFDASSIYVYQAYRPAIADYAVKHQQFGGEFSYSRMSWIKPNFLWMMYRSGWALKEGQERILAIQLPRTFFDHLLQSAVASSFNRARHSSAEEWQRQVANSDVRLQWGSGPRSLRSPAGATCRSTRSPGRDTASLRHDGTPFRYGHY